MIIFDYKCTKCENIEERYVIKHDDIPHCTKCGHYMEKSVPAVGLLRTNFQNKPSVKNK